MTDASSDYYIGYLPSGRTRLVKIDHGLKISQEK
jgi:hypothetical protein